ncbi:MAG TPA: thiamine diphosphokinase [Rectinemataceae bacterium]|nr:thiamine diphosphokinase [Rectinemataceae bacterium]
MKALLVSGGDAPPRQRLESRMGEFELICAADSGLDVLRSWGIAPDIIVGDMDSISDPRVLDEYSSSLVYRADRDKDETDTELGLGLLQARGATEIVLAGGGGGRLDHLLAIRSLLSRALRPQEWHTRHEVAYVLESGRELAFACPIGETVSVFPLGPQASAMGSRGLRWALDGLSWGLGDFGVSNRTVETEVRIRAGIGDLLVVRLLEPERTEARRQ